MTRMSRRIRRFGAIVLLFAWAPVATANAGPCAVWCYMNGGAQAHVTSMGHAGHMHGTSHGGSGPTISSAGHCDTPQLMVVAAVTPSLLVAPTQAVTAGDPVSALHSLVSSFAQTDTPPPRA